MKKLIAGFIAGLIVSVVTVTVTSFQETVEIHEEFGECVWAELFNEDRSGEMVTRGAVCEAAAKCFAAVAVRFPARP